MKGKLVEATADFPRDSQRRCKFATARQGCQRAMDIRVKPKSGHPSSSHVHIRQYIGQDA
jgi:hypothetical protein